VTTIDMPRDRETLPPSKETYNKRRYDESFAVSRHREEARRAERKHVPSSQSFKGERSSEGLLEHNPPQPAQPSHPSDPPRPSLEHFQMSKQFNFSPEHVRERPFRLALQKKFSGELKLKNKVGDLGDSSESVSSAQKSLRFADETNHPNSKAMDLLPPATSEEKKKKSWYELTMEEEEEALELAESQSGVEEKNTVMEDPNGEKKLEEEDWMVDGDTFDDDDLMDEDEMAFYENQKEEENEPPRVTGTAPLSPDVPFVPKANLEEGKTEKKKNGIGGKITEPRLRREGSSSTLSLKSPMTKRKGSPNHMAAGLSLRKRNLILGWA